MGDDMRRWLSFDVEGAACAATLDEAAGTHGLLIVSGGNEIRSGAHHGMARLAAAVAAAGHPVLRFDRRGVGDSEGDNRGFEHSGEDIAAALALFRRECPHLTHVTAFGNCDAAAALLLHHREAGPDTLLLANPWTIDATGDGDGDAADALPPPAAIRARYAAKLKDPREWLRLLRGGVDLGKLVRGLRSARTAPTATGLVAQLAAAFGRIDCPVTVLLANRDGTAQAFAAAWHSPLFAGVRSKAVVETIDSGSHGFADAEARAWLKARVLGVLSA